MAESPRSVPQNPQQGGHIKGIQERVVRVGHRQSCSDLINKVALNDNPISVSPW